jgi:glycosyltransferase involved in cell wall biosynthesis
LWRYTSVAVARWHRRSAKPYVVHPHGMLDCWAVRNSRWKKMIASVLYERSMLNQAACIRALCQSEADSIRNYGCQNPICIIPNGMDFPKGPFAEPAWQGYVEPGVKVLFYLGRLHPKKGLANLLRAWANIKSADAVDRNEDRGRHDANKWTLVIAGWGEGGHELELKRLADELGIPWVDVRDKKDGGVRSGGSDLKKVVPGQGGLIFLGPQFGRAKADCYHHCDAFILPSLSEGLPMVVLEAWSHAKPVLMTPACNLPEGFEAQAAIQIGTGPAEILPGLQQLFAISPAERNELGKRGWHLISDKFSWERVSSQLLAVSEWVVHGGVLPESVCCDRTTVGVLRGAINNRITGRTGTTREPNATAR